jgi:hypothetical protein
MDVILMDMVLMGGAVVDMLLMDAPAATPCNGTLQPLHRTHTATAAP